MQTAWAKGDLKEAFRLRDLLAPLHDAMFVETSPAPVKYAASLLGLATDEVRLPLVPATDAARTAVRAAMSKAGLLS
jgi:4-hydroxy-tetrahydrodipicolinate synthase